MDILCRVFRSVIAETVVVVYRISFHVKLNLDNDEVGLSLDFNNEGQGFN